MNRLRRFYDRTMDIAAHARAPHVLFWISYVEAFFALVPPQAMLIAMVLAARDRAWKLASLATIGSVLGGLTGYAIGLFLFESAGRWLLEMNGLADGFERFAAHYNEYGAWIVFIAGVTPIPYKLVTIASGATGLDLTVFIASSVAARGLVFFSIAALIYYFGPAARRFIEARLGLVAATVLVMLFAGFAAIRVFV
ncbi:YqaA family protein [Hyphomicrobium sp. CS1BSMeth3]|uniref:YqaA family protein n=1 Tax=Hyphomicrobium sp. CS1BSMeth3 TaxID=1892844 RepID=UPI000930EB0D|nr:YqaA family protein [Hyphomicrobium sp. CS1BSMeth3]